MLTTTKELQQQAIQSARDMQWMVCTEGNDYTACVIAWSKGPGTKNGLLTNWCRVMTIIDGIAQTETVTCEPTVMDSGYVSTISSTSNSTLKPNGYSNSQTW